MKGLKDSHPSHRMLPSRRSYGSFQSTRSHCGSHRLGPYAEGPCAMYLHG